LTVTAVMSRAGSNPPGPTVRREKLGVSGALLIARGEARFTRLVMGPHQDGLIRRDLRVIIADVGRHLEIERGRVHARAGNCSNPHFLERSPFANLDRDVA